MLCYVMLCYVMLCYVMLCYVMLCYVMLCYVMLCYVMLCYVMLCYVMLCYVMLCYVMLSKHLCNFSSYTMKKKPYFEAKKKKGARGRRGLPTLKTHQFPLQVDEFAFKLQVSITTEKEITAMIALLDPKGKMREPLVNMSHSIIYSIDKPAMGTWTLVVSHKVGKFDYVARVKSNSVIQFGYYYVLDYNGIASPVAHPLKGDFNNVI